MNDTPARFEFTGTAREYFRIWIVNVFLTIVTLGIYSAWAKVRKERYFHGNTILDGHRFDFVSDPVRILRGRLLAVLALVTYTAIWQLQPQFGLYAFTALVLALPALIVLSVGFRLHNTTHRNIRFGLRRDEHRHADCAIQSEHVAPEAEPDVAMSRVVQPESDR